MAEQGETVRPAEATTAENVAPQGRSYPPEAYDFVQRGLHFAVTRQHGQSAAPGQNRHITGRELSLGLRDFAHLQWGMLAQNVLKRWGIVSTFDFGSMVFAMIDAGLLQKTPHDTIDDFRDVFDFADFDLNYRLESRT